MLKSPLALALTLPLPLPLPLHIETLLPPGLHAQCRRVACPAGSRLFLSGQRPRWMYVVLSGEVVLERHGLQGRAACLQRCRSGFVGEASLSSDRYHCDARATVDTQVIRMPVRAVREALAHDRAFADRWIDMLGREVRRLRLQAERLALPKVQDRLLHLVETEGTAGGYTLTGSLKDLAGQLAVTHKALYRGLAQLVASGRLERWAGGMRLPASR